MKVLAFLFLLGCSSGEYTFDNSTNNTISKTCFNVSTSPSTLVNHSSFPKVANSTGPFLFYPTSPPLRSPIPIWENKTSSSYNHSSELGPSSFSPTLEINTRTRTTSSPTAPPEFDSAALLLLVLLPIAL
jgi:hypothetical protein